MFPGDGEEIVCDGCGKKTVARLDPKYYWHGTPEQRWISVSEVTIGEELSWLYFCNMRCLKKYASTLVIE